MPVMKWKDDEIVVGCLSFDLRKKTVRACREVADILYRDFIHPVLGENPPRRIPEIRSLPVIGDPSRAWVIMVLDVDDLPEGVLRVHEKYRDDAHYDRAYLIIGQVSPDGGRIVRGKNIFPWSGEWKDLYHVTIEGRGLFPWTVSSRKDEKGFFEFHPAFLHPGGDLLLPGLRICRNLRILKRHEIKIRFQGIWPAKPTPFPVYDFRVHHPSVQFRRIHPRLENEYPANDDHPGGFVVWADPKSRLALWMIAKRNWYGEGSLRLVNVDTMEILWKVDHVTPNLTMAIPDGRWFSFRYERDILRGIDHTSLLIGVRDRYTEYRGLKLANHIIGFLPLSDERWVLASDSWLLILNGMELESCLETPLQPLLYVSGILASADDEFVSLIPESGIEISRIHERTFEMKAQAVKASGKLGAVIGENGSKIVFIPSGKMVVDPYLFTTRCDRILEIGDGGYLVINPRDERFSSEMTLYFYDPGGNFVNRAELEGFNAESTVRVVPVSQGFLIIASRLMYDHHKKPEEWNEEWAIVLFDRNGAKVQERRLIMERSSAFLEHIRLPDASHIVIRFPGRKNTLNIIVKENEGMMVAFSV